jgi:hypothetical protein
MNPVTSQALPLRDIHLPPAPEFWPPAPGWWVLAVLLLVALLAAIVYGLRLLRLHRHRRNVLAALEELGEGESTESRGAPLAAAVSALLKRVALARFPRKEVASLTGNAWLAFLDRTGGGGGFVSGPGRVLAIAAYTPDAVVDGAALIDLAKDWVRRNT